MTNLSLFGWVVTITAILLIPLISLAYLFFRLEARREQLVSLFTLPGILRAYLISKGWEVHSKTDEKDEEQLKQLKATFEKIFRVEFSREYGKARYIVAISVASAVTVIVILALAWGRLGGFLQGVPNSFPEAIDFALLGAFAWAIWALLTSFDNLDLTPSTFYWLVFRYIMAVIAGLISSTLFKNNGIDLVFALVASAIPYPQLVDFLRSKVPGLEQAHAGEPALWNIQGMHQPTVERLHSLGIHTTQELAYVDPLMLLFRTNFQPKVVIDWIDQSILFNYLGEKMPELRRRGIRGAIELSTPNFDKEIIRDLSKVIEISETELSHLIEMLRYDYQVQLVTSIWDVFSFDDDDDDDEGDVDETRTTENVTEEIQGLEASTTHTSLEEPAPVSAAKNVLG